MASDYVNVYEKLGGNIKRIRIKKGLSQQELAEKARIDLTTVSELESGLRNTSVKILNQISSALATSIKELFNY